MYVSGNIGMDYPTKTLVEGTVADRTVSHMKIYEIPGTILTKLLAEEDSRKHRIRAEKCREWSGQAHQSEHEVSGDFL